MIDWKYQIEHMPFKARYVVSYVIDERAIMHDRKYMQYEMAIKLATLFEHRRSLVLAFEERTERDHYPDPPTRLSLYAYIGSDQPFEEDVKKALDKLQQQVGDSSFDWRPNETMPEDYYAGG